jgi:hypothetical protein
MNGAQRSGGMAVGEMRAKVFELTAFSTYGAGRIIVYVLNQVFFR